MTDALVEDFLAQFDDSRFPVDFLQRYELLECLSQTALGETLLVKDRQTGEYSIAKCYAEKALVARTTESDLLKRLQHTGLPALIGEHHNEQTLCVVRAFAPGQSLDQFVRESPLTDRQALAIALQLCDILTYLHGQTPPVIHRDIKPQNIIIDDQGKVTLIDFGVSRLFNETSQADTLCFGTRHYAAPEQYGFSQSDARSDIYSLGVVLGWLLTGRADAAHAPQSIPNSRLAKIVATCTAFDPKDRFQTAAQVKDALTGRTVRRRRLLVALSAMLMIPALILLWFNLAGLPNQPIADLTFKEPLIEQAVRLTLDKAEDETLSEDDLASISELYIFGDKAAANEKTFQVYATRFANSEGTVRRGSIKSLADVARLPNLRRISLVYQNITDLTPIVGLLNLDNLDLRHNPVADVTPLAQVSSLRDLSLFDTNVTDLTVLRACPHLSTLDVGYTPITSTAALDGLDGLQVLKIRKAPLQTLDHIGTHPLLEEIYLSETQLLDLAPLLDLPRLRLVEVDDRLRTAAEAIAGQAAFKIIHQ
ncbi:MAG: protein kinase [Thermoflexales bacterium]|nr:protein kinase [Thermoflexales bacterium]